MKIEKIIINKQNATLFAMLLQLDYHFMKMGRHGTCYFYKEEPKYNYEKYLSEKAIYLSKENARQFGIDKYTYKINTLYAF